MQNRRDGDFHFETSSKNFRSMQFRIRQRSSNNKVNVNVTKAGPLNFMPPQGLRLSFDGETLRDGRARHAPQVHQRVPRGKQSRRRADSLEAEV